MINSEKTSRTGYAMISVYLIISLFRLASGCPEEALSPCSCRLIANKANEVVCKDATDIDKLQKSLSKMNDLPIQTLQVIDSSLMFFPSIFFEGLSIEKMHLINSTFMDLSDSELAFTGLENSLKSLIIQRCRVYNGWAWTELKNLKSLTWFKTLKSGLDVIDSDIEDIAGLNLEVLELTQDTVSYVDEKAFSHFKNLKVLSLKANQISDVKRSMFPEPALKLTQINLSYNQIENLPDDIFTNMPSLISLILSGNHILTIEEPAFSSVWKQLKKVDLSDNPLRCDCRMKWVVRAGFPRTTYGECDQPSNLSEKSLDELIVDDLTYC
ncbi:leucine-rich repeat and immunoglobulin-like domain-containing nogo receptor-interacting protein 2 [Argiope bruennichi]|nr:leucine-rich repeat and immunoglobulin-like domain-containing nogo receptor-interacting protein 2 [Argiope bruennichi]